MPAGKSARRRRRPELLAPAGGPDAGYAALHYGADAVYLGLTRYSARAGAVNFTPEQLAEFAAHAHSLAPPRRVYLALNTLIKHSELADAAETAALAADAGADAVIVQDLGMARFIRERLPGLAIHASTQMAVHNLAGVEAAAGLGCSRVTLARELTLAEVTGIAAGAGIEVEVFIHGALCYSYSGLCFFSSFASGRSGSRGRCAYSCRLAAASPGAGRPAHPFSLKDLALGERAADLAGAGAASLKIEGRQKSPLYVAAAVDYYRRILDGTLSPEEKAAAEANLKTIFARPWTRLFLDGKRNPGAADPELVGHRGALLGKIKGFVDTPGGPGIRFTPSLPLERHDGCQIDVPGRLRPYGFPVERLYRLENGRPQAVFSIPAGAEAALPLPADAPPLEAGLPICLASSQAVKRAYPFFRPKPGGRGAETPLDLEIILKAAASPALAEVVCRGGSGGAFFQSRGEAPAFPARDPEKAETAAREAFSRLGGKRRRLAGWTFRNPEALFVKPSDWNRLRREWLAGLEAESARLLAARRSEFARLAAASPPARAAVRPEKRLALFADDPRCLADLAAEDFPACAELVVGIAGLARPGDLASLVRRSGREKIRLALPVIHRGDLGRLLESWLAEGWNRWLLPGLAGRLEILAARPGADLAADWTLPALNGWAAGELLSLGFSSFTLSPEDDEKNWLALLGLHPEQAWLPIYSETPLFVSAACAHSHLGLCASAGPPCREAGRGLELQAGPAGRIRLWAAGCGTVVTGEFPFRPAAGRLRRLEEAGGLNQRLDLRWRPYSPGEAARLWRLALAGRLPPGREGNLERGLA